MRLTMKSTNPNYCEQYIPNDNANYDSNVCLDKLGQLEDIEEEYGISLIILFKAVNSSIYTRKGTHLHIGFDLIEQDSKGDWYFSTVDGDYYFKDYGKTWELTEEKLKND